LNMNYGFAIWMAISNRIWNYIVQDKFK
jgi:hypothetical protein